MANNANYKLATQAILMAYELLAPDSRSTDDLKQHLTTVQKAGESEREIFLESMILLEDGLKHAKWFYID